ncbi:MAG: hypothetical protein NC095_02560 [Muribaculum sp.]|nr:hypothetical protein [Muribaculum sp.]
MVERTDGAGGNGFLLPGKIFFVKNEGEIWWSGGKVVILPMQTVMEAPVRGLCGGMQKSNFAKAEFEVYKFKSLKVYKLGGLKLRIVKSCRQNKPINP